MKYGTCVSSCLSRSCRRVNDSVQMWQRQRFFVVETSGMIVLWIREDDAGKLGCGSVWINFSVLAHCPTGCQSQGEINHQVIHIRSEKKIRLTWCDAEHWQKKFEVLFSLCVCWR
jgi:hypothetical protein